jgi:hypothetical protein
MDADPRPAWLSRAELAVVAAMVAVAVGAWLAFGVLPTYDSLYSLVWGREILDGAAPGFADFGAPTQHPLWVAFSTVLAPFGGAGARAMTLVAVLSFVVLLAATYHLGRTAFGPLAGAVAAALLVSRLNFCFYAAFAFVDMPFAALVIAAAALEAQRPRRGGVVWVLLVLAGLLRPEGWAFAAAYGLWLWRGADGPARLRIVAWVAIAPLLWALSDLVATGDPLFSWTYTTGEAGKLGRQRSWDETPGALWSALAELLKPPLALVGFAGVALVVSRWRPSRGERLPAVAGPAQAPAAAGSARAPAVAGSAQASAAAGSARGPGVARSRVARAAVPLALLVLGAATFGVVVLGGVSGQVPRYAVIAAVALLLFAGELVAWLLRPRSGTVPRVARALAIVLLIGGAAWTASRLHPKSVTSLLGFRQDVEEDLDRVLHSEPVRRARRCGPVAVPTHKLVPVVRWQLDAPADDAVARNDPDAAGRPGVVLLERGKGLIHDPGYGAFGQQGAGSSPVSAQEPPAGYAHRGHTRFFEIYTRC